MTKTIKSIALSTLTVLISVLIVVSIVKAVDGNGLLNPAGTPAATMYTLEDIYQKIVAGSAQVAHTLSPDGAPAGGLMHTLTQIYGIIPANNKVLYGTNGGTANTPPGSGTAATVTEVLPGYYAFNAAGTALPGSATLVLEWSTDQGSIGWAAAIAACAAIGGRLPASGELEAAMTNQVVNLSPFMSGFGDNVQYWSSTENGAYYAVAFSWDSYDNSVNEINMQDKESPSSTRCVR